MSEATPDDRGVLTLRERRMLTRMPSDRAILAVLTTGGLVASFMQTIVTPIIPQLPELLQSNTADASWVLTSTLLAASISIPISGRLGDMFGKRRMYFALLVCLLLGSVVSALSDTLTPMIIGRVLQGIGIGVISLGVSILRDTMPPKRLGGAVALVSATLGIGGAAGLPLAAWVAENYDWRLLFWMAAAATTLTIAALFAFVPVSTLRTGGRFDFGGAIGLAVGLVGILLAVSKGSEWGWTSPLTLGLLIGGVLVLVLWGWFELRVRNPLVDLRIAARRPVLLTNLASIAFGFAFFVATAALPVILETPTTSDVGLGLPLVVASLCLMPLGVVMFLVSPLASRLSAARGPRTSLVIGGAIVAAAFALGIVLLGEIWHVILISAVVGLGVGLAYAAMPTLIMRAVPPEETAAANGLNSVMRTLGSTVAAAVVGVILATNIDTAGFPTADAFRIVFTVGTTVVLAGVVAGLFIPRREVYATASIPIQVAAGD